MSILNTYIKFASFCLLTVFITACEKEYSYEGQNLPPVPVIPIDTTADTTVATTPPIPDCPFCIESDDVQESSWSFKVGNSLLCGKVDTAIILSLTRDNFTFFGPSLCGGDTGIIFTVSLGNNTLNSDMINISAVKTVFYYYHTNEPFILFSRNDQPFWLFISRYVHATRIASGTFGGSAFLQDGTKVQVTQGKFKIKLN